MLSLQKYWKPSVGGDLDQQTNTTESGRNLQLVCVWIIVFKVWSQIVSHVRRGRGIEVVVPIWSLLYVSGVVGQQGGRRRVLFLRRWEWSVKTDKE